MNTYSIGLFLHIVGALGVFVALGLEWTGLRQIRSAVALEVVRGWMRLLGGLRRFGFASMLTTVITGIYMMLAYWGAAPWAIVTIGSLVLVIALSLALSGPRMAAVGRALARETGPLSTTFHTLAGHPLLSISIDTRVAIGLGIVFLKIARPDLAGSLLTIGVAILMGLAPALLVPRSERALERPAG